MDVVMFLEYIFDNAAKHYNFHKNNSQHDFN